MERCHGPQIHGGCGIGSLRDMNLALLSKWKWRFKTKSHALWARVTKAIHFQQRKVLAIPINTKVRGVWNGIMAGEKDLMKENINFDNFLSANVGNGEKVYFWLDSCIGGAPLKVLFSDLFKLEKAKRALVAKRCVSDASGFRWVWEWTRRPV